MHERGRPDNRSLASRKDYSVLSSSSSADSWSSSSRSRSRSLSSSSCPEREVPDKELETADEAIVSQVVEKLKEKSLFPPHEATEADLGVLEKDRQLNAIQAQIESVDADLAKKAITPRKAAKKQLKLFDKFK